MVYPDPATDKIAIKLSDEKAGGIVSLVNLEGQQVLQQKLTGSNTIIDISTLHSGVYLVKMVGEGGVQVRKFVKE